MGIRGYTKNYKLIKPEYDTDTWHDYEYDNLDTIDAVMSAIYASGDWQGFWTNNTTYNSGSIVIDRDTDTMYKVLVEHTTGNESFNDFYTAHPDYYRLWSPNNLAEDWAIKTDGEVETGEYSAKAHASSEGLVPTGSAKEWADQSKQARDDIFNNENFVTVTASIADVNAVGQNIDSVITNAANIDSIKITANNIDAVIEAKPNADKSRIWATGSDLEVQELEENEHSSRTYSNFAMALANTPEDVPILESQLLATNVIKGEKGDKGEAWDGGEVNHPVTFKGDDNHPVNVEGMAGATPSGIQLTDSLGAGESYFEQYNSGDRYGTKIRNKNKVTGQTVEMNLYQTNAGKSVLDLSEINTILAPQLLDVIYPVGSIYITTNDTCPIEGLGVGVWELVAKDRVLQGAGTRGVVGATIDESLPNITGKLRSSAVSASDASGAFYYETQPSGQGLAGADAGALKWNSVAGLDASRSSSTYQDGAPVQQDAYLVNIFRRVQ